MKPLYLVLLVIALCCAYIYTLKVQASSLFPKPAATYSVKFDDGDVIDATNVQHLKFASKHLCITPDSSVCWESGPEVEIQ